jgi:hypothetical protein
LGKDEQSTNHPLGLFIFIAAQKLLSWYCSTGTEDCCLPAHYMSEGRHPAFGSALPEDYSFGKGWASPFFSPNFSGHVGQMFVWVSKKNGASLTNIFGPPNC